MRGDFSRHTHRPDKQFAAVLAQQGRVQLDAEANEQTAIQLALSRTIAADIIGPRGGPGDGFRITYVAAADGEPAGLDIAAGHYYVDGVLADATRPAAPDAVPGPGGGERVGEPGAPRPWTYWDQPYARFDPELDSDEVLRTFPFVVYLKVWDQLITAVEDPEILEPALGAALPDTAARMRATWQVLARPLGNTDDPVGAFDEWVAGVRPDAHLAARAERPDRVENDPCVLPPDSRYRGPENQLYRVEIHRGAADENTPATFKWSRDNGSVVFPISEIDDAWVSLTTLGRDDKLDLHPGDWVEVVDDVATARGEVAALLQVSEVDLPARRVRLSASPAGQVGRRAADHPYLRRWDHTVSRRGPALSDGALVIREGEWIDLEDGVQVWFQDGGTYQSGDYWLIPARTLGGTVEWPQGATGTPLLKPPDGVPYHYAPLAWITGPTAVQDLRRTFLPLTEPR